MRPMSQGFTLHGLLWLHLIHLIVACIPIANIWTSLAFFRKKFEDTEYTINPLIIQDYYRIRKAIPGVVSLNAIVTAAALIVIVLEAHRKKSFPLIVEFAWCGTALALQGGVVGVLLKYNPKWLVIISEMGYNAGPKDANGRFLQVNDAATTMLTGFQLLLLFAFMTMFVLGVHILWHTLFILRHVRSHPRTIMQSTPRKYRWNLPAEDEKPRLGPSSAVLAAAAAAATNVDHTEIKLENSDFNNPPVKEVEAPEPTTQTPPEEKRSSKWSKVRSWVGPSRRDSGAGSTTSDEVGTAV